MRKYYEGPFFKLWRGSWSPTFKLWRGSWVSLLNFRGVPSPTFKLWGGSWVPGPGVLVPLLHHAITLMGFNSRKMCDVFDFLWDQGAHMFFWKEKQSWSIAFFRRKYLYWVSCFKISFCDDNINQMNQLTRDHMWNCDKSKM